jgi:hypothetical protein
MRQSLLIIACLLPKIVLANELLLTFEFPATYTPAPSGFIVSYANAIENKQPVHQFSLPNAGKASCAGMAGITITDDSLCGRPPNCLEPGIYTFQVRAQWDGEESAESEPARCVVKAACEYDCAILSVPPALQPLLDHPPATQESLAQALKDIPSLVQSLPSTPSVSVAVPTQALPPLTPT